MGSPTQPEFNAGYFCCLHCEVVSQQFWVKMIHRDDRSSECEVQKATCATCSEPSFWVNGELAWPAQRFGPSPPDDLTTAEHVIYEEARRVAAQSPRSACALLRLVVQQVIESVGGSGRTLEANVKAAIENGLIPGALRPALDAVRLVGNQAVHEGQFALDDDGETLATLFELIGLIVSTTRSLPAKAHEIVAARAVRVQQNKTPGQTANT